MTNATQSAKPATTTAHNAPVTFYLTAQPQSQPVIDWHPPELMHDALTRAIVASIDSHYELIAFGPARASTGGSRTPRIIHAGDDHVQALHPGDPISLLVRGVLAIGDDDSRLPIDDSGRTLGDYVAAIRTQ